MGMFWGQVGQGPVQVARSVCVIEPYLPTGRFGPYPGRLRKQFEGVIWRFRSSGQWREMPSKFGPWATVYGRFRV